MNQYEMQNAARSIHGYYYPRPEEGVLGHLEIAFERAKAELIKNLRANISHAEEMSAAQFFSELRIKPPAEGPGETGEGRDK